MISETTIKWIIGLCVLATFVLLVSLGMTLEEKRECTAWQKVAPQYTWAQWQVDQCNYQNLPLPQ